MYSVGYVKFKNIDCVYLEEGQVIRLIALNQNENLVRYINEQNFILIYNYSIYKRTAYIKNIKQTDDHYSILLIPYYVFDVLNVEAQINNFKIHGFNIVGDAIDDFFTPVNYFYENRNNRTNTVDLIYNRENVELWKINFENTTLSISLSYGDILSNGIASDLMLHPKLAINFENDTDDLNFIYRVYNFIVNFLKLVRYDLNIGCNSMELISNNGFMCGRFFELNSSYIQNCVYKSININYMSYRPYLERFMQFVASNPKISLAHLPHGKLRISSEDYTAQTFIKIFGAFEKECKECEELYLNINSMPVELIRGKLVKYAKKLKKLTKIEEEKSFIDKAIKQLEKIDKECGQKTKIINCFNVLAPAIESLIPSILYLSYRKDSEFNIAAIAKELSSKRGKIIHDEIDYKFDDVEIQRIRLLEILTYAQMLKRAQFNDSEIESIVKFVFML